MLKKFGSTLKMLAANRDAGIAPIFALTFLAVLMIVGFSVDLRRTQSAKTHLQAATDAAVLAAAREYMLSSDIKDVAQREANAKQVAVDYLNANLIVSSSEFEKADIDLKFEKDGEIIASTSGKIDLVFGGLFGKEDLLLPSVAGATVGDARRLEIVLALDNSTSMFKQDRMVKLRKAAKNFTDTIFDSAQGENTAQIGVVPWGTTVNINMEAPKAWNASSGANPLLAAAGSREIPKKAFEDRLKHLYAPNTYSGSYTKDQLELDFSPVAWRGCISAASNERRVDSKGKVIKSLSDAPVSGMKWPALRIDPEIREKWVKPDHKPSGGSTGGSTGDNTGGPKQSTSLPQKGSIFATYSHENSAYAPTNSHEIESIIAKYADVSIEAPQLIKSGKVDGCTDPDINAIGDCNIHTYVPPNKAQCKNSKGKYQSCMVFNCWQDDKQWNNKGLRNSWLPADVSCSNTYEKVSTGKLDACVSDPNEFEYIKNEGSSGACNWIKEKEFIPWKKVNQPSAGPNVTCPSAMLGMSQSRPQIFDKLNHIYPTPGGTQADVGLMWGLRMMSPRSEWSSFFGYSTKAKPGEFNDLGSRKMLILLSDGKNDAPYHFDGYYGCTEAEISGNSESGRLWTGDCKLAEGIEKLNDKSLNNLMMDACEAIVKNGVELYTIALDLDETKKGDKKAIDLLADCAGDPERAFNITNGELDSTFEGLAARALRLSR